MFTFFYSKATLYYLVSVRISKESLKFYLKLYYLCACVLQ